MRFNRLDDWLDWQLKLHPKSIDMGLVRVKQVATKLAIDSDAFSGSEATVITVAGTNGKGSCVKTLESLLLKSRKTVGSFTSPHIIRYNERIKINGHPVSDDQLCRAFSDIDAARQDISLTYFEFSTLAALLLFKQARVEYVLLEVGLGGRLDSTNIIDTDLAVITSIDIDHCEYLGHDRESIGREKAGIFRSGVAAIVADPLPPESIGLMAKQVGAHLFLVERDFQYHVRDGQFHWRCLPRDHLSSAVISTKLPKLPLPSVAAAVMALQLVSALPPIGDVVSTLENIELVGRSQTVMIDGLEFVLDVAHNPAAAASLAKAAELRPNKTRYAICAMMADKDVTSVLQPLVDSIDYWLLPGLPENDRSMNASELCNKLFDLNTDATVDQFATVSGAIDSIRQRFLASTESTEKPVVFVFGSFFTVEAALNYFHISVD